VGERLLLGEVLSVTVGWLSASVPWIADMAKSFAEQFNPARDENERLLASGVHGHHSPAKREWRLL